jgi:methionyl-tRNA formyltransferase
MTDTPLPSMRIIYFSNQSPEVVNAVIEGLEALDQQVLLLVTTPGPRARPNTEYQITVANTRRDLDILVTTHMGRLAGMLRPLEPDLIFTTGFSWKLPSELLTLPRLGSVNAHPSVLPRYRGPNPLYWHFINDETQGGLTMHRMDADFDTGPILVQRYRQFLSKTACGRWTYDTRDAASCSCWYTGHDSTRRGCQLCATLHRSGSHARLDSSRRTIAQPGSRLG